MKSSLANALTIVDLIGDSWDTRSVTQHCDDVKKVLKETTKTKIQKAESKYGVRYSVLVRVVLF